MSKAYNIAKGGLYVALTLIVLYLSSILTINKFFLLGVASCIIPLSIITTNIKNSYLVYIASSLLALLIGLKGIALAYIIFFGLYGFIKLYIEKIRIFILELVIKLIYFNISLFIIFSLYKFLFLGNASSKFPIYYLIIIFEVLFLVYDYAMTMFIGYINNKFKS